MMGVAVSHETGTIPAAPRQSALRTALAGLIGNVLEWFDFAVYGYFASDIGSQFFPKSSHAAQQLLTFGVFALGFLARPFGSIVLGAVGDRIGRRALLTLSIALMGGATLVMGLLPTYAQIGMAAPALLVAMRVIQGFSLGGEFTGSMVYTTEQASPTMRGLVSSSTAAGTTIGLRLAGDPVAERRSRGELGLAHPVHRERVALYLRMAVAARHPRDGRRREGGGDASRTAALARRRLAANRAHVRHRGDDERGVLPHVHVRGGTAKEPQRRRRRGVPAREYAQPACRVDLETARRVAVGPHRPPASDDRVDRRDDGRDLRRAPDDALRIAAGIHRRAAVAGGAARNGAWAAGGDGRRDLSAANARDVHELRVLHHARAGRRHRTARLDVVDRDARPSARAGLLHHAVRRPGADLDVADA